MSLSTRARDNSMLSRSDCNAISSGLRLMALDREARSSADSI